MTKFDPDAHSTRVAGALHPPLVDDAVHSPRDAAAVRPPLSDGKTSRRSVLGAGAALATATWLAPRSAQGAKSEATTSLAATPPEGFVPLSAPGVVVQVKKPGSLLPNMIYPKPDDALEMLTKALAELSGKSDLPSALGAFIHKDDVVVVKVNGIALRNMATNKELVLPVLAGLVELGVPPERITVLEQYQSFMAGTRIDASNVPKGVKLAIHANANATMDFRLIPGTGVKTKFCRYLTEATACINFALVKDHSICGYTGVMKNMTHGCNINPHDFHVHHASPQIALLYAQDVIRTRVRLNITDAFKVMAHGGPLDKMPEYRFPYEAVLVSTDPVAMDTVGAELVEEFRKQKRLRTLAAEGRPPAYLKTAAELGLGVHAREQIDLRTHTLA